MAWPVSSGTDQMPVGDLLKSARPLYQTLLVPPARMPSIKGFKLDEAIVLRQMRKIKAERQKYLDLD